MDYFESGYGELFQHWLVKVDNMQHGDAQLCESGREERLYARYKDTLFLHSF